MNEKLKNWIKEGISLHSGSLAELDQFYFSAPIPIHKYDFSTWEEIREFYFRKRAEIIRKTQKSELKLINQLNY